MVKLQSRNGIGRVKRFNIKEDVAFRLDLGCGPNKREGFKGADVIKFKGVDYVVDFNKTWPWKDNSVDEAHCSHCLEHFSGVERMHFINELYRVMKHDAKCTIICPHWSSCRAYGDPTHKWPPISEFALFYWNRKWRLDNAPHDDESHNPKGFNCNFDTTWGYNIDPSTQTRSQEYQQHAIQYYKEACQDIIITVTAIKKDVLP